MESLRGLLIRRGFDEFAINSAVVSADEILAQLDTNNRYNAITIFDSDYPVSLNVLGNSRPIVLYAYGATDITRSCTLGVIGTRHPDEHVTMYSPYLIKHAIDIANPVIVSGMAIGCDTIGHKTAIENNAKTIAILPCGFNKLPKFKKTLCEEIVSKGGLILSEYPPEAAETRFTPVQRDSLIAAMSERLISLQCGIKSGTMQTIEVGHKLRKPIACYMPSVMEGDFAGHQYSIEKYNAKPLRSREDLEIFLTIKIPTPDHEEQLSLFN